MTLPAALATACTALLSLAFLAAVFVPLERALPARPGQRILRADLGIDALFFAGQYLLWNALAVYTIEHVRPLLASRLATSLPVPVLVVLAVALGDLAVYWFHRASHAWEPLWRFHAVHHTATELDWVAAHREHPVDGVLTQVCMNAPAILLGVPPAVLGGIVAFRAVWAVLIHANVRIPLGPLGWVFGSPALHHFHHVRGRAVTHNFANLGPWLDWLFGTHHEPEASAEGETYPLGIDEPWPRGYLAQLVYPFVLLGRSFSEPSRSGGGSRAPSTRARSSSSTRAR